MEMLEEAAGGDLFDRRLVLHREHTAPAPAGHVDAGGKAWDTTKPLGRYFSRLDRVVLVDDDSYKSIEGEEANMLVVPCWQEDDMDCPVLRLLCDLLVAQVASDRQSEDPDVRRWTAIVSEELQKVATKEVEPSSLIATPDVAKSGIKDVRKILGTNGEDRVSGGNDSGGNASEVSGGGACEDEDAGKRRQEPGVERVGKRHRKLPGMILSDPAEIRLN
ncbi:hypothetical protein Vretimale_16148 [Volvox reticuliferus]|nr:hypothetical protein Vretifemale_16995 [Volvox reticuliferus]GIM12954.1 hypothetical protein Vretimale_16148 [Volvox reticuliferus]